MVKPGGTGKPMRLISARFAPLPPSSGFMLPLPSAFLLPNRYTYFADFEFVAIRFYFNDKVSVVGSPLKRSAEFSKAEMGVNAGESDNPVARRTKCAKKASKSSASSGPNPDSADKICVIMRKKWSVHRHICAG